MATYHCPHCRKVLKKGDYAPWVKWLIGPIFGQLLKPLICQEHGQIDIQSLPAKERRTANAARLTGVIVGVLFNILVVALLICFTLCDL